MLCPCGIFLENFCSKFSYLLSVSNITHNVRSLIHLPKDVLNRKTPDKVSCFPFESYLCNLKFSIYGPRNPAQHLYRRLCECVTSDNPDCSAHIQDDVEKPIHRFRRCQNAVLVNHIIFSPSPPNNIAIADDKSVEIVGVYERSQNPRSLTTCTYIPLAVRTMIIYCFLFVALYIPPAHNMTLEEYDPVQ